MPIRPFAVPTFLVWGLWIATAGAADVTLTVNVAQPLHPVSPRLYGVFFEDINFGGDGGLSAELVKNGAFEFPQALMGWSEFKGGGAEGEVGVREEEPALAASPHFARLRASTLGDGYGIANDGFRGMGVRAGEPYQFSALARAVAGAAALRLALVDEAGEELAVATIDGIGPEWSEHAAVLRPSGTTAKARLVITLGSPGTVDLDGVSLSPENTWKNRPHGLRADLAQLLADLQPAFFRFPGGCIVEGRDLANRYQWKRTIGDRRERQLIVNRWNTEFAHRLTPDYFQSFGVGFFEYFQLAEDMGAEPLPILNCGMACQFNTGELVPLDELDAYIDDALDLIEFANGPVTSEWGAKRAAMGQPEPFGMKLLGVGNEQWGPYYFERYERFAAVLQEKHPEIELISGSGPFPADRQFHYAWPRLRALGADIVDEHCYAMPDWFLRAATRYDAYDRAGPKVFMGEYAAQTVDICSPDNRNNLRGALAEAAFLTGIERNSDMVVMSAYAPLMGHEQAWQWRPNLIWFDNLSAYATPNYYVQQLFSRHRGGVVLPVELQDSRPAQPAHGRIGLVADRAEVEFTNLRVEQGGDAVFETALVAGPREMNTFRGRWQVADGVIRQTDPNATARAHFGDFHWRDYTLALRARKVSGRGGFGVVFRNSDGGSYLQWSLGGGDNLERRVEAHLATHSEEDTTVERKSGSIQANRWYDVRVELAGSHVRCYLDGKLIHDLELPPPNLPRLYATASRDEQSGEVILKVVNPTAEEATVDLQLDGVAAVEARARAVVLRGRPEDENSLEHPDRVAPVEEELHVPQPRFSHTFAPYSLSVVRIDVNED